MDLHLDNFRAFLDQSIKPIWEKTVADNNWQLRPGGGEQPIQERILKKAQPFLTYENLKASCRANLLKVLSFHINLLSQFETSFAKHFIENTDEDLLFDYFESLLFSSDPLEERLSRFLNQVSLKKVPGLEIKSGINGTVCSFFMAMSNPKEYPYCKPLAYNTAVDLLLSKEQRETHPARRILHCRTIYKAILELLEKEYGLQDGNLLDVHSLCYQLSTLASTQLTETKTLSDRKPDPKQPDQGHDHSAVIASLFIEEKDFNQCIELLRCKKNIILQGPPGVGKTFIARRLAWAMTGQMNGPRTKIVQFHQSFAYEDFIQGFRPNEEGGFYLKNGVFYEFCRQAKAAPENAFVLIVDEINRGNLSKIFGELMMLIESDKRGTDYAVRLTYASADDEPFFVPANVYLIGTMNTADRSLAMVDYALRRRFSFVDLPPCFGKPKFNAHLKNTGVPEAIVERINSRFESLNARIAGETHTLGKGFCIGHSHFCPNSEGAAHDGAWYQRVVDYEIAPLLKEYWFDDPQKAEDEIKKLLD